MMNKSSKTTAPPPNNNIGGIVNLVVAPQVAMHNQDLWMWPDVEKRPVQMYIINLRLPRWDSHGLGGS